MSSSLLHPYKSIGLVLSEPQPHLYSAGPKSFLVTACNHSFKVYNLPAMSISLLGPHLPNKITHIHGQNNYLFIVSGLQLILMNFHHIVRTYDHTYEIQDFLIMGNEILLLLDVQGNLLVMNREFEILHSFQIENALKIVHPQTYVNKILLVKEQSLVLVNFMTQKKLFEFEGFEKIQNVISSPVIDVVAVADGNQVVFFNIRSNERLFSLKQKNAITAMAFTQSDKPLLATGDKDGNITFWDLNEKQVFSTLRQAHDGLVSSLNFMTNELVLISGSAEDNSLYQWVFDENSEHKFEKLRQRQGVREAIQKMRFYGDDGLHLLASTENKKSELFDISLLNEAMSIKYSIKENKQIKQKNYNTERMVSMSRINDFCFSTNRESDWANIISSHEFSDRPSLWSADNKSIIKQNVQIFEDKEMRKQMESTESTSVNVSKCGNFSVIGFSNGLISKVNMQSGKNNLVFQGHKHEICSLLIEFSNSFLISADVSGTIMKHDFYLGTHLQTEVIKPIQSLKQSNYSSLFMIIYQDCTIEIWDTDKFKKARTYLLNDSINDAFFSPDNKFVFVATQDKKLTIFEILSGKQINQIELENSIKTMDITQDGELVATVFEGAREVQLWHNQVYMRPWSQGSCFVKFESEIKQDLKRNIYQKKLVNETQTLNQDQFDFPKQDHEMIRYTDVPSGHFMPLIHLDLIKEKNKPTGGKQMDVKVPFFLDFTKKDEIQKNLQQEFLQFKSDQSKIFKNQRDQHMEQLGTQMEIFLKQNEQDPQDLLKYLKALSPSQLDYEFRKNFFGDERALMVMLNFFKLQFSLNNDFDLLQIYFKVFLNITYDQIMQQDDSKQLLNSILNVSQDKWQNINDKFTENICLLEHFSKITN